MCLLFHNWYQKMGNHMVAPVDPRNGAVAKLPGEWLYDKRPEGPVYRWERHCLDCNHREYKAQLPGGAQWLPVPKKWDSILA